MNAVYHYSHNQSKPCSACGKNKSKNDYDKEEYKKPSAIRTCIECQKSGTTSQTVKPPRISVGSRGARAQTTSTVSIVNGQLTLEEA